MKVHITGLMASLTGGEAQPDTMAGTALDQEVLIFPQEAYPLKDTPKMSNLGLKLGKFSEFRQVFSKFLKIHILPQICSHIPHIQCILIYNIRRTSQEDHLKPNFAEKKASQMAV